MFWFGAAVSLCYLPGLTGAYIATQWPLLSAVLCVTLIVRGPFTWAHAFGLVFVAYAAARVPYAFSPSSGVWGLWMVSIMALCVWFGTVLTDARELYKGLAVGGAISSAIAIAQYWGLGWPPAQSVNPSGLYLNSVQQGEILALLAVALTIERMWIWILPLAPGFYLCGSRGAMLMLLAGLVGTQWRSRWLLLLLPAVVAVFLLAPHGPSDQLRMLIWQTAAHHLTLWGWGPGTFFDIAIPYDGPINYPRIFFPEYAHNDALQLVFEYGVFALAPLALFAFTLSRVDVLEWPVVFAFAVASCYSFPLHMPITAFLGLVAVGRVLRAYGRNERHSHYGGFSFVSREFGGTRGSGRLVPVASHHQAEG